MKLETRVFELCKGKYKNIKELARNMGVSWQYVYQVRQGRRGPSQKFVVGAVKAFPGYTLNDLFYVVPDGSENEGTTNEAGIVAGSRRDEAVKLRERGLTYAEVGHELGITEQQAWGIINKKPGKKPDLNSRVMLTTSDVAQLLGLHVNTVRRWRSEGILKSYRIGPRGDRRFRREDIESFLKEGEIE